MAQSFAAERTDTLGRRLHNGDGSGSRHFDSTRDKFAARVTPTDPIACWEWQGAIAAQTGYGTLGMRYAHRISYELHVGPIPPGMTIDHLCRNRPCVNPAHLEVVTLAENIRRAGILRRQDTCKRGHSFTDPTNLYHRSDGSRMCRSCALIRASKRAGKA